MRRVTNTNLLFWLLIKLIKALTEHFLQRNVPLRHLINAKPPVLSWRRFAFNEVNDLAQWVKWCLKQLSKNDLRCFVCLGGSEKKNSCGQFSFVVIIKKIRFSKLNWWAIMMFITKTSFKRSKFYGSFSIFFSISFYK